ncbi:MAG: hypothetical protein LBD84_06995 [Campylobacteraceae bacterium]|nr:hypothetical protein [Campylobacteraceae bacterium]
MIPNPTRHTAGSRSSDRTELCFKKMIAKLLIFNILANLCFYAKRVNNEDGSLWIKEFIST